MSDAIWALLAIILLLVPFWLAKLWLWVWLIVAIALVVGIMEGVAVLSSRRTLSQQFGDFRRRHRMAAFALLALLALAWGALLWHLAVI